MSKLQFRARALDASKPMLIYMAEELPDLTDYSAINRAVPQMPSGMEKEEECEHHLQRAICTGLIIPTPEVSDIADVEAYDKMYPATYKQPRQLIHMQPFTMEQDIPDYDMDSEDERWVEAQAQRLALTPFKFETMMDRLEKSSGQTVIQLQEAKLLLKENDDLTIAVYDYWLNKRLKIQQPLILNVKTEHRGGSGSASSPYLAFRRRTEKMQTRKNRKNDEVSYEKMLKLRRDLTRAISILDLIKRRERSKRDLLHLQIEIIDKRYKAQDYNGSLISEVSAMKASRPAFAPLFSNQFVNQNWANSKAVVKPDDLLVPRKEKRQYKKRKHKSTSSHTNKTALAASGLEQLSSDEDELPAPANIFVAAEEADQTDAEESPFAFRRNVNCSYHMPVANGYGNWPWCSREDNGLADHKYRFTLASVSYPKRRCIGFARRRLGRGGRVILDRVSTPMDDFWRDLDFTIIDTHRENERTKPKNVESNGRTTIDAGCSSVSELKNVHSEHNYNISSTSVRTSSYNRSSSSVSSYSSNSSAVSFGCSLSQQNRLKAETDFDNLVAKTLGTVKRTSSASSTNDLITNKKLSVDDVNKYVVDNIKTEPVEWTSVSTANAILQVKQEPSDMSIEPSVNERLSAETSETKTSSTVNSVVHSSDRSEIAKNLEMLEFLQEIRKDWLHFRPKTPPPDYEPPCHLLPVDDTPFNPSDGTPIKVEIETLTLGAPSMLVDSSTFTSEITLSDLYTDFSLDQLQFDTGTTTTYDYLGSSLKDTRQPDENTSANNNKQNSFNDSDHIDSQQFGSSSVKWIDDLNSGSTLIADRTLNNNAVCDLGSRNVNSASVLIQTRKQNINVTNDSTQQQQSILSSTLTSPKLNSVNNRYGEKKVSARIFCSDDEVVMLPSHIGSQYRLGLVNHVLESSKDATPSSSTAVTTQTSHHRPMSAVTQALLSNGPVYHTDSLSPNRRVLKQQQTQQTSTAYSTGATVIGGQVITGLATARMANQRLFTTASPVKRPPSTTHTLNSNSNSANLLELPQLDSIDNGKVKVTAQLNSGGTGGDSGAASAAANAKQTQQSTNNKQQIVRKTNNTLAMEVT